MFSLPSSTTVGCNSDRKPFDGGSFLLFLFCSLASSRSVCHHEKLPQQQHHSRYLPFFTSCIPQNDINRCRVATARSSLVTLILSICRDELSHRQCLYATLFPFPISAHLHRMVVLPFATIPATIHHHCATTEQLLSKI